METKTQDSEKLQLLQTVEMFEAVTQANPDDYQSLEILREAYLKLGRDQDSMRISKQIARAHLNLGQISQALQHYEGVLKKLPDDAETKAAVEDLQRQVLEGEAAGDDHRAGHGHEAPTGKDGDELLCDLIVKRASRLRQNFSDPDGDELLCELIVKHDRGLLAPDQLLAFVTERTNLAHMPLGIYEVIPDIVRLQPRDISFKYCTMPFDRIGRTLLMASANPFDEPAKKAAEKVLDYNLQWYVCAPQEITQILKDVYLVGKASTKDD
jgi:tetratricopeptide (TPR) repeat protein